MATRNRFILMGVGILVLLIVVALVSIPLFLNADRFRTDIESTLSNALGRQVTLGRLDLSIWSGSLVAQKASIADDPAFSNQPFLQASLVKIHVALIPFIFRRELHIIGFELVGPQITLLRAGNGAWNYESIGRASMKNGNTQAQAGAMLPNLSAGHIDVSDGTLNVGAGPGAGARAIGVPNLVYNGVRLDVKYFSLKKPFPFTASARLPDAGSVSIRGAAGPMNTQDASLTPVTAHAEVKHLNLASAHVLDASSGVTGLIDGISIDGTWSGQRLQVARLLIASPRLVIVHAAMRPAAVPGAVLRAVSGAAPASNSMTSSLSVDSLEVKNGVITVAATGQPASTAVYPQVNLTASNYSSKTSSPFTLSAELPGGGSLNSSGNAGPFNQQNAAATPVDAQISLKHADLAASGLLAAGSSIGGVLNLDARATSDGHMLNANGVAHMEGLRLAVDASPSSQPVDVRFAGTQNIQSHAGQLQHSTVAIGTAVINVAGTYQTSGQDTQVSLKVDAPSILIDQIQAFLPSLGIKLPSGSRLQGGTLTTSLNVTGPIDNTVISGPLRLDNTQLAGFDLGSKLPSIAALTGLHPGSATAIRSLSLDLRVANGSIQTNNVALVVPALGSATGNGTIAAGGALDYHVLLKLAALSGGSAGAAAGGSLGGQLMGMIAGGAGKSIGGLAGSALKNGIPIAVGGTTSNPTFAPELAGMPSTVGRNAQSPGKSIGNALGGLLNGRH